MHASNREIAESLRSQHPDIYAVLEEVAAKRKTTVEAVIGRVIEMEGFLMAPRSGAGRGSSC